MKYKTWQARPERFVAMTGYKIENFKKLLPYFEEAHQQYLAKFHMSGKRRKGGRQYVMYKNTPLPCMAERLVFILSYLKLNPLQEQQADMFEIEQKQCHEYVHGLTIILHQALEAIGSVPEQTNEELQEVLLENFKEKKEEEKVLIHDGTEREIPKPVEDEAQQDNYSGKKKKHTVKNTIIISACCMILFVGETFAGRVHDKKIADTAYTIPSDFTLYQDGGYQGYLPESVNIMQPDKKPKGGRLTQEQKDKNKEISSKRVYVEHTIGSIKRYRIVKDECRLRKNNFVGSIFAACAALHNFRLQKLPRSYKFNLT
jgi:hypothetical protein